MATNMLFLPPIMKKTKSNRGLSFVSFPAFPALGVVCMFFAPSSDWFAVIVVSFDWSGYARFDFRNRPEKLNAM